MKKLVLGICGSPGSGAGYFCQNMHDLKNISFSRTLINRADTLKEISFDFQNTNIVIREIESPCFYLDNCFEYLNNNSDKIIFCVPQVDFLFEASERTTNAFLTYASRAGLNRKLIALVNDPYLGKSSRGYLDKSLFSDIFSELNLGSDVFFTQIGKDLTETKKEDLFAIYKTAILV